jgi:hypothetical protein
VVIVVIEEEDGVREMRRRKVRAAEEQGGPEMYGAGPFFRVWRMRRGTKQKSGPSDNCYAGCAKVRVSCWKLEKASQVSPRLDCDCLAGLDGSRTIALR